MAFLKVVIFILPLLPVINASSDPLEDQDTTIHYPRADDGCGGVPDFMQCGAGFSISFCCGTNTVCFDFNDYTGVVCCPKNASCSSISPVTCDATLFNATTFPTNPIHLLVPEELTPCGSGTCCPIGYQCSDGICLLDSSATQNLATSTLGTPNTMMTHSMMDIPTFTMATTMATASASANADSGTGAVCPATYPAQSIVLGLFMGLIVGTASGFLFHFWRKRHWANTNAEASGSRYIGWREIQTDFLGHLPWHKKEPTPKMQELDSSSSPGGWEPNEPNSSKRWTLGHAIQNGIFANMPWRRRPLSPKQQEVNSSASLRRWELGDPSSPRRWELRSTKTVVLK